MCRKRDHDGGGRHLKGGVNFHQELIPYLDSTGPENQKRLAGPKFNVSQAGRRGLMRDGMVNRPSVEPSGLIDARVIVPHATSREDKAYGRSDCGGRREGNSGITQSE
jgi:hypothetical protein